MYIELFHVYISIECPFKELLNNGVCNYETNNELCSYDGGDCCPGTMCHQNKDISLLHLFTPNCGL